MNNGVFRCDAYSIYLFLLNVLSSYQRLSMTATLCHSPIPRKKCKKEQKKAKGKKSKEEDGNALCQLLWPICILIKK